jgi:GTPase SAR1 family protein
MQLIFSSTRYRVVLLGDSGVGKTALVSQFMTSEYMHTYDASLGKYLKGDFKFSLLMFDGLQLVGMLPIVFRQLCVIFV